MGTIKKIISWLLQLFGNVAVEKVIDIAEDKTGWDIPEDTIIEFANKILPKVLDDPNAKLWDKQAEILEKMESGNVLVEGDKATGKTILLIIHAVYTMFKKPNTTVVLNTISGNTQIFSKIVNVVDNIKDEFGVEKTTYLKNKLELSNGSKIILSNSETLEDVRGLKIDLFIGDALSLWEDKAIDALIKHIPTIDGKIQLVTDSDWDEKLNKVIDYAPEGIEVVKLLFFDKDKDLGEKARSIVATLGKDEFLKQIGTIFK